jgi:hypothetical protein
MLLSMAVMVPRERWTDERLDESFDRIDADLRELLVEMKGGFEKIDKRLERADDKFNSLQGEMTTRFDAVQRNMMTWAIALFSTIVSLNAAVIAAIAFS